MSDTVESAEKSDGGETRRDFLLIATSTVGAVGAAFAIWPLIHSMNPAADVLAAATARARAIPSTDDVTLRAFRVEAPAEPPKAVVLLVHGLFRSAMELEPIAQLFRDEGCECWLLDLRNFGGRLALWRATAHRSPTGTGECFITLPLGRQAQRLARHLGH